MSLAGYWYFNMYSALKLFIIHNLSMKGRLTVCAESELIQGILDAITILPLNNRGPNNSSLLFAFGSLLNPSYDRQRKNIWAPHLWIFNTYLSLK